MGTTLYCLLFVFLFLFFFFTHLFIDLFSSIFCFLEFVFVFICWGDNLFISGVYSSKVGELSSELFRQSIPCLPWESQDFEGITSYRHSCISNKWAAFLYERKPAGVLIMSRSFHRLWLVLWRCIFSKPSHTLPCSSNIKFFLPGLHPGLQYGVNVLFTSFLWRLFVCELGKGCFCRFHWRWMDSLFSAFAQGMKLSGIIRESQLTQAF